MDAVALASVITSGVLGITTSAVAVWSTQQSAKLVRETRTQQRLAESYLELLRSVEREGQWIAASIPRWEWSVDRAEGVRGLARELARQDWPEQGRARFRPVPLPERAVAYWATIAAHLAAFGSDNMQRLYQAWRSTITAIDSEKDALRWNAEQGPPYGPSRDDLKQLRDVLVPNEAAARQALEDAIAGELGHR